MGACSSLTSYLSPGLQENFASVNFEGTLLALFWALGEEAQDTPVNRSVLALKSMSVAVTEGIPCRLEPNKLFRPALLRGAVVRLAEEGVRVLSQSDGGGGGWMGA